MVAVSQILNAQLNITEVDKNCININDNKCGDKNFKTEIGLIEFEGINEIARK